jgi:hypothetical protein
VHGRKTSLINVIWQKLIHLKSQPKPKPFALHYDYETKVIIMGRLLDSFATFKLIFKLALWAVFGLTLFIFRFIKSRLTRHKASPSPALTMTALSKEAFAQSNPFDEVDPYGAEDDNAANILALRYL